MSLRAISRRGTVRRVVDGCATIEVSVPCSTCAQGACMGRQKPGSLTVQNLGVEAGDPVDVALAARQLNAACFGLFGPGVAWLLLLAAMSSNGMLASIGSTPGVLIGASGLIIALLVGAGIGRKSAARLAQGIAVRTLGGSVAHRSTDETQDRVPHVVQLNT